MRFYKCKGRIYIGMIFILMASFVSSSPSDEEAPSEQLRNLSLEQLLNVKISVSSIKEETVVKSASNVTVIDKKMIEKYHFQDIVQALKTVAGLDVYQTIIDRNVPTIRGVLQNFYANKVLLLINNIPTWQPIYGEGAIERISIQDVEKIEVLKGPASVLYRTNAYVGVINIILKKPKDNKLSVYGQIGKNNQFSSGVSANFTVNDISLFASINTKDKTSDSYKVRSAEGFDYNGELEFDYANNNDLSNINIGLDYKKHSFYFNQYNYTHSFLGIHPSFIGGGGKDVNNDGRLLNYKYQTRLTENTNFEAHIVYDYFKREFPVSHDLTNKIELAGARYAGDLWFDYQKNNLNIEYGLSQEKRVSDGHNIYDISTGGLIHKNLTDDDDITEWSTFVRMKYNMDDISILAGGRYTSNQKFGDNFSVRLSSVFAVGENQSLKLIAGQSFRVPTMFELYFDHPTVVGNADLKPEKGTSYEIAYLYGSQNIFLQVLGYYGINKDLIQRITPDTGPPSQYQNASSLKGYGTEIELKYIYNESFEGYINYNLIKAVDETLDNNYCFVPDHTLSFGLSKNFESTSISLIGNYISGVEGHLKSIKPQYTADINFTYKQQLVGFDLRHVLSITNITNSKMLTPEYIRQTPNINDIVTADFGVGFSYAIYAGF